MGLARKILESINKVELSDDDLNIIADILRNDVNSSDKEIVQSILNNFNGIDKKKVDTLVKKERGNFMGPKYINLRATDDIKIIRRYF